MTTIFTTLPPVWEWIALVAAVFLLLSWLYVMSLVRSLRRTVDDLVADVRHTADRLSRTTRGQQGDLIRRIGSVRRSSTMTDADPIPKAQADTERTAEKL